MQNVRHKQEQPEAHKKKTFEGVSGHGQRLMGTAMPRTLPPPRPCPRQRELASRRRMKPSISTGQWAGSLMKTREGQWRRLPGPPSEQSLVKEQTSWTEALNRGLQRPRAALQGPGHIEAGLLGTVGGAEHNHQRPEARSEERMQCPRLGPERCCPG